MVSQYRPRSRFENRFKLRLWHFVVLGIFTLIPIGIRGVASIQFNRQCAGYLKRASDANSLELAEAELTKALKYCHEREFHTVSGRSLGFYDDHTSIIYTTPNEQISFWYKNIRSSRNELRDVLNQKFKPGGKEATSLEKSNVLMKLRETLLDDSDSGHRVTVPKGLSVYPFNVPLAIWYCLSVVFIVGFIISSKK